MSSLFKCVLSTLSAPKVAFYTSKPKSSTSVLKHPDLARPVNYRAHQLNLFLAEKYISSLTMAHDKPYLFLI